MFVLVHRLDGASEQVELKSDATVADLRVHLEQDLPDFCEIKLLHGTRELMDGCAIEGEVSAVVAQSPAKVLAVIDDTVAAVEDFHFHIRFGLELPESTRKVGHNFQTLKKKLVVALRELYEMGVLAAEHCARFLDLFPRIRVFMSLPPSRLEPRWLAELFVHTCADLAPYAAHLRSEVQTGLQRELHFVVFACARAAARDGREAVPSKVRAALMAKVKFWKFSPRLRSDTEFARCLLQLIGHYGSAAHARVLGISLGDASCPTNWRADITAALENICAREALPAADFAASAKADAAADGETEAGPNVSAAAGTHAQGNVVDAVRAPAARLRNKIRNV